MSKWMIRCCVAPLLEGKTDAVIDEEFLGKVKADGVTILTCCTVAISDVYLDIEDLSIIGRLPLLTPPCRIDSVKKLNDDVVGIVLRFSPRK